MRGEVDGDENSDFFRLRFFRCRRRRLSLSLSQTTCRRFVSTREKGQLEEDDGSGGETEEEEEEGIFEEEDAANVMSLAGRRGRGAVGVDGGVGGRATPAAPPKRPRPPSPGDSES